MRYLDIRDLGVRHHFIVSIRPMLVLNRVFTARCSCGWSSSRRSERQWAIEDWEKHMRWMEIERKYTDLTY